MKPEIIIILMALLAAGYLGTRLASWLRIPHSVFLVSLGLAAGGLWRVQMPIQGQDFFPSFIFYMLLPPLIFESAFRLDFGQFKKDLASICVLSFAGLIVSTAFVGAGLHWVFGISLVPALAFGALISATDPVAVIALFREVGAPPRLSVLIEGESLLNDGTSIVLFRLLVGASVGAVSVPKLLLSGAWHFIVITLGSVALGTVAALLCSLALRFACRSASAQLGLTVVFAYLSFVIADAYLHCSGVISTLIFGLYLGQRVRTELNSQAHAGANQFWEFIALSANTLIFFAVGLSVNPAAIAKDFRFVPISIGIVLLARVVSILATVPALNGFFRIRPISMPYQVILIWGGLRGALALALVLTLPKAFPYHDLFLALAVAIVLTTLIVNALTTPKVLAVLKLDRLSDGDEDIYRHALTHVQEETRATLQRLINEEAFSSRLVADYQKLTGDLAPVKLLSRLPKTADRYEITVNFEQRRLLAEELRIYQQRLSDGTLSREAYRELSSSIETRNSKEKSSFSDQETLPLGFDHSLKMFERILFLARSTGADRLLARLVVHLEILLHCRSALESVQATASLPESKAVYGTWIAEVAQQMKNFYSQYAHYRASAQTLVIAKTVAAISNRRVDNLLKTAVISSAVEAKLRPQLDRARAIGFAHAKQLLRPSASYLLNRADPFLALPRAVIRRLAEASPVRVIDVGNFVVHTGEEKASLFVVVAGCLRVSPPQGFPDNYRAELVAGDWFGLGPLLGKGTHRSGVLAQVPSEVLELTRQVLDSVLRDYPGLIQNLEDAFHVRGDSYATHGSSHLEDGVEYSKFGHVAGFER